MSEVFEKHLAELFQTTTKKVAVIREAECIGCAPSALALALSMRFLGGAKLMHTVINFECTGCELCIAPCPVDCIDMIISPEKNATEKINHYTERYQAHTQRLQQEKTKQHRSEQRNLVAISDKKTYLQAAIKRIQAKKSPLK